MYTHEGPRLYLTEAGAVVEEGDTRARTLLVGTGGQLPIADAERYGLLARSAPPDKASKKPKSTKGAPAEQPSADAADHDGDDAGAAGEGA